MASKSWADKSIVGRLLFITLTLWVLFEHISSSVDDTVRNGLAFSFRTTAASNIPLAKEEVRSLSVVMLAVSRNLEWGETRPTNTV